MNDALPTSQQAFETLYAKSSDPWQFATSPYERGRYAATLAALCRERYGAAFEPGCSVGELTVELAKRCAHVLASDFSPTAVARARVRCQALPNVTVECADLTKKMPPGPFDLIVFSEIGYYFAEEELQSVARRLLERLAPGGEWLAVHWLGQSADHVLHGDRVHEILRSELPLNWRCGSRFPGFRIDTWTKE